MLQFQPLNICENDLTTFNQEQQYFWRMFANFFYQITPIQTLPKQDELYINNSIF